METGCGINIKSWWVLNGVGARNISFKVVVSDDHHRTMKSCSSSLNTLSLASSYSVTSGSSVFDKGGLSLLISML